MAFYESEARSLWQIVGMAIRTAVSINLHRKDSIFLAPYATAMESTATSERFNEYRKRVFWSLYVLDRLSTLVSGGPTFLRDQDIDVEVSGQCGAKAYASATR